MTLDEFLQSYPLRSEHERMMVEWAWMEATRPELRPDCDAARVFDKSGLSELDVELGVPAGSVAKFVHDNPPRKETDKMYIGICPICGQPLSNTLHQCPGPSHGTAVPPEQSIIYSDGLTAYLPVLNRIADALERIAAAMEKSDS